jgi:hypothetical protein
VSVGRHETVELNFGLGGTGTYPDLWTEPGERGGLASIRAIALPEKPSGTTRHPWGTRSEAGLGEREREPDSLGLGCGTAASSDNVSGTSTGERVLVTPLKLLNVAGDEREATNFSLNVCGQSLTMCHRRRPCQLSEIGLRQANFKAWVPFPRGQDLVRPATGRCPGRSSRGLA